MLIYFLTWGRPQRGQSPTGGTKVGLFLGRGQRPSGFAERRRPLRGRTSCRRPKRWEIAKDRPCVGPPIYTPKKNDLRGAACLHPSRMNIGHRFAMPPRRLDFGTRLRQGQLPLGLFDYWYSSPKGDASVSYINNFFS